jgi:hypothetical protein
VIAALKAEALLNESVGAGYIDRNWPPALAESGAWPLSSLRQSFLNGALTRLLDPDRVLRAKVVEFVGRGDFGLASGPKPDGGYQRVWHEEPVPPEEVTFESGVFLLRKGVAEAFRRGRTPGAVPGVSAGPTAVPPATVAPIAAPPAPPPGMPPETRTLRLVGSVPPEIWNRQARRSCPSSVQGLISELASSSRSAFVPTWLRPSRRSYAKHWTNSG